MSCKTGKKFGAKKYMSKCRKGSGNGKEKSESLTKKYRRTCRIFKKLFRGNLSKRSKSLCLMSKPTVKAARFCKAQEAELKVGARAGLKNTRAFIPIGKARTPNFGKSLTPPMSFRRTLEARFWRGSAALRKA